MNNHSKQDHKGSMTPITLLRWIVLWFPLALCPIAVFGAGHYSLVLREETISPIVGVPSFIAYLSPVVAFAYLGLILLISRQQILDAIQHGPYNTGAVLFMIPLTLLFTIWGTGQTLNGTLDFSQPQNFQTKVIGSTYFSTTPYIKVQDWNHPGKYVYFVGGKAALERHPVGSTLMVTTKKGFLGYEWYFNNQ